MLVQLEHMMENGQEFCKAADFKYQNILFEHTEYILTFSSYECKRMFYDHHKKYLYENDKKACWVLDIPDDVTLALLLLELE